MIPLKLRLHNFMCYRGDATLDLSGIHLACLAGENGHGKSALLDALTYALWGETRARREEDLMTMGTDEMEVELEFMLGDERYRVIRKRSKRGKTRQGLLELQTWDGEQFLAQGGTSTRETQARIIALLRMSYETFINSAFLLQGRADEFARKPAGERKQILGDILGLSLYDEYEEQTRQIVKQLEEESQRLDGEIAVTQQELKLKPQHEAELARLEREFAQTDAQLQTAEAALQQLRDEKRDLDAQAKQADELAQRLGNARHEVQQLGTDAARKHAIIAAYEARVQDEPRIMEGFSAWQAARQRDSDLNVLFNQSLKLTAEQSRLMQQVREARQALEFDLRSCTERCAMFDTQIADATARVPDLERARQSLAQLNEKELQRDQLREQREVYNTHIIELKSANQHLRAHMEALKEKLALLQNATAVCPLCGQPIAADEAARLSGEYQEEGKQARATFNADNETIQKLTWQSEQAKTTITKLEQDLRAKAATQAHEARLSDQLQRAAAAQLEREQAQNQAEALRQQLASGGYASEAQNQLTHLQAQLTALGYDNAEHDRVRQAIGTLAPFEQEYAQLQSARERLAAEREVLHHLEANLLRAQQLIAVDEARWLQLKGELTRYDDVNRRVVDYQRQVNELSGRAGVLNRQLGAARQWVEHAKQMEVTLGEKRLALKTCHTERALHEELRVAFGKKGVQAMLIEAAIPEIEEEANALLSQMTDGRMSVRFETQREKLSAKKDEAATIETLDIVISDELGPRNYEMYSGGEAFRVNFAVRIALSKLLARRAGARLQTLVIDEGFGALDSTGRERLVEAITAVQNQFEKILVITHIDELKDMFPVRIDIVKTGSGSSIFVN